MRFTPNPIILSVQTSSLPNIIEAREKYGEFLPFRPGGPESEGIKTLLGHKDRAGSDDLRAGIFGTTVIGVELNDGTLAFIGHYAQGLIDALGVDPLTEGVRVLTEEEFEALLPGGA